MIEAASAYVQKTGFSRLSVVGTRLLLGVKVGRWRCAVQRSMYAGDDGRMPGPGWRKCTAYRDRTRWPAVIASLERELRRQSEPMTASPGFLVTLLRAVKGAELVAVWIPYIRQVHRAQFAFPQTGRFFD